MKFRRMFTTITPHVLSKMATSTNEVEKVVRKLRKKLRQIEHLERLNRDLSDEEIIKISSKDSLRERLQDALAELREIEEQTGPEEREEQDFQVNDYSGGDNQEFEQVESSSAQEDEYEDDNREDIIERKGGGEADVKTVEQENKEVGQTEVPKPAAGAGDVPSSTKPAKKKKSNKPEGLARRPCKVQYLEGHSDLITNLVLVGDRLITASRDTTLRCWDLKTKSEVRILGGHTESVTCVIVLDQTVTQHIGPSLARNDQIIVSGAFDCSFKLWSLQTGTMLKSTYTYNPVTALAYMYSAQLLVSGSDGGKLELWDLLTGENRWSSIAHSELVSGIKVSDNLVYSSCADGVIKVHQYNNNAEGQLMSCIFESERLVCTMTGKPILARHVRSLELAKSGLLVYGDDSRNLKIVDWKKGTVTKVSNHNHNYSSADALCCHGDYLMASSYDLDQGLGYINVFTSQNLSYVATIDDRDTERIMCIAHAQQQTGSYLIVTGGIDLKLWEIGKPGEKFRTTEDESLIQTEFWTLLNRPAKDSDSESDGEGDLSDDEIDEEDDDEEKQEEEEEGRRREASQEGGLLSWCTVL